MIYQIRNDHYRNFAIYKENVLKPRSYFIPFHSIEALAQTDIRNERYRSDAVTVLSGQWDFRYYEKESELPERFDSDEEFLEKVTVPSCWQFTGYEKPYYVNTRYQFTPHPPEIPADCSVGVYRKTFEIDDIGANYVLSFLGVAGALDVFVNGKYVGYSEGSHNTAEFEISEWLNEGSNEVIAVVHKFSNGTYLECQDMFRNNGIFRDVLLTKTGDNSVYDFEVKTSYHGDHTYDLTIFPSLKLRDECVLSAHLFYDGEAVAEKSVDVSPERIDKICFEHLDAVQWSAETPNLYTLVLSLSKEGKIVEIISRPIGFKHIEIQGNVFYFNGEKIKLLGVNHHDTDPKKGYVMSVDDMERDVRIFKEYNVNCVRTSHYPPDPIFLDLCDAYGIYVIDEADIETHGCQTELHQPGACSHHPKWQNRYWDRVYRMFERDKNHPSITMWSLGNEAWGYRNQDFCYGELKKRTDIPVHYENVVRTRRFAYDVISQMYPWQGKMKKIANGKGLPKKWYQKPYFLCEYAHAMGVGAGELETYVSDFLRADNILGGCIWEFADHAVYHEKGAYRYTYGGDHGEEKHDKNFCVDGLFAPDRTPHAGALQMKNCYRPVRAEYNDADALSFYNHYYFKQAKLTAKWETYNEGGKTEEGEFELLLDPQEKQLFPFHLHHASCIVIRYFDGDVEVAGEQINCGTGETTVRSQTDHRECDVKVIDDGLLIHCGKNRQEAKLGVSVYRAPLDNDMYLRKVWDKMALSTERLTLKRKDSRSASYTLSTDNIKKLAEIKIEWESVNNGAIRFRLICCQCKPIPYAPRFGLTLQLPCEWENVKYFGLGERQNLPDFKEHTLLGEYACKVDEMREAYIKPQESSMRSGVRWAEVTDENGHGVRFEAEGETMIFSADHFTAQQCAAANHQEDLQLQNLTYLHLDAYQLGAGSAACGPPPTKAYRRHTLKGCELSIKVRNI